MIPDMTIRCYINGPEKLFFTKEEFENLPERQQKENHTMACRVGKIAVPMFLLGAISRPSLFTFLCDASLGDFALYALHFRNDPVFRSAGKEVIEDVRSIGKKVVEYARSAEKAIVSWVSEPNSDLKRIAERFVTFKNKDILKRTIYPQEYWAEAFSLNGSHSIAEIAKAIHVNKSVVQRKFERLALA